MESLQEGVPPGRSLSGLQAAPNPLPSLSSPLSQRVNSLTSLSSHPPSKPSLQSPSPWLGLPASGQPSRRRNEEP